MTTFRKDIMAAGAERLADSGGRAQPGALSGIRVIELADEQAEYCGLTLAGLGGSEQGCIDPDHLGPSSDLRPAMAQAGQKPVSPVSAVSTPLTASTEPSSVGPICVSEQATINAPPITRAQLSLEPMFLR